MVTVLNMTEYENFIITVFDIRSLPCMFVCTDNTYLCLCIMKLKEYISFSVVQYDNTMF